MPTWTQVGLQNEAENEVTFEKFFLRNLGFSFWEIQFFEIQKVEVGGKNRSKIDVKNDAETKRLGNSILMDFKWISEPSWPSKTKPRRSKIDVEMASKFDQLLKASWNATFSAQEPPRRASAADRRRRWRLLGEDLGGGRQEPLRRRIRKEDP